MTSKQVSQLIDKMVKAAGGYEPMVGEPFASNALKDLPDDYPKKDELQAFAEEFKFSHRRHSNMLFMRDAGGGDKYVVSCGMDKNQIQMQFYKLLGDVEREPICKEELTCHISCMIVDFFEKAMAHYNALQSIAAESKPNPNSPWARNG